jgi:hypothetical protein
VIAAEIDQKRRGKRYKTATPAIISGQIAPLSRDRRSIGDMLSCAVNANCFSSKAFRTKPNRLPSPDSRRNDLRPERPRGDSNDFDLE